MPNQQKDHSEREEELIHYFHGAPIARTFGMRLHYENGAAVFDLPYNPNLNHALGGIHGGAIATLIDNAGWFTVAPHFENWIATVEFKTHLLEPARECDLQSRGKLVRLGKNISIAEMEVRGINGKLVAIGSGTFVATSVPMRSTAPHPGRSYDGRSSRNHSRS